MVLIQEAVTVRCACGCGGSWEARVAELTRRCVVVETPRGWAYFDRETGAGMGGTRGVAVLDGGDLAALAPTGGEA